MNTLYTETYALHQGQPDAFLTLFEKDYTNSFSTLSQIVRSLFEMKCTSFDRFNQSPDRQLPDGPVLLHWTFKVPFQNLPKAFIVQAEHLLLIHKNEALPIAYMVIQCEDMVKFHFFMEPDVLSSVMNWPEDPTDIPSAWLNQLLSTFSHAIDPKHLPDLQTDIF